MSRKKAKFSRKGLKNNFRRRIVISGEGETECEYFKYVGRLFGNQIAIKCLEPYNSSPNGVHRRMHDYIERYGLGNDDEAWLVVDRDERNDKEFNPIRQWSELNQNHNIAISIPKFEYWLLLHFEDGNKIRSGKQCDERLANELNVQSIREVKNPDLNVLRKFRKDNVKRAMERAKDRIRISENPNWPKEYGTTTVHLLVAKICTYHDK